MGTNLVSKGKIKAGGFQLTDGTDIAAAEMGFVDGVTAGTVSASKALVANSALELATWAPTGTTTEAIDISRTTGTTGDLVKLTENGSNTGARSVLKLVQDHASATGAIGLSIQQDAANEALLIDQNGNGESIIIDTEATSAKAIDVACNTLTTGVALDLSDADSLTTGILVDAQANSSATTAFTLVNVQNTHTSATGAKPVLITQKSTGSALIVDMDGITGYALEIDQDSNSANTVYAMKIDSDNAGAGVGGGIDFSNLGVDEPIAKVVADAITTAGTVSHQIAVDIGSTTYYIVAYTHGS